MAQLKRLRARQDSRASEFLDGRDFRVTGRLGLVVAFAKNFSYLLSISENEVVVLLITSFGAVTKARLIFLPWVEKTHSH